MNLPRILQALEASALADWLRNSLYAFPLIESLHVVGLTLVFGTAAIIDLRLLGLASTSRPFSRIAAETMTWTWIAFGLTATTGALMFITNAQVYSDNLPFRLKMTLLLLAGLNVLIFNLTARRTIDQWSTDRAAPRAGRLAAAVSLIIWIGVIALGRWVGFTKPTDLAPENEILINLDKFR
jgi:uncharacterized protein DUF6644